MVEQLTVNQPVPGSSPGGPVDNYGVIPYNCLVQHIFIMNVENLVRSGVLLVVGLPITLGVAVSALKDGTPRSARVLSETKASLTEACLDYAVSKADSKLERNAQDAIDKILGADGADYKALCNYVL